jgi:TPR repeat protein
MSNINLVSGEIVKSTGSTQKLVENEPEISDEALSEMYCRARYNDLSAIQRLRECADRGHCIAQGFISIVLILSPHQSPDNRELAERYSLEVFPVLERRSKSDKYSQFIIGCFLDEGMGGYTKNDKEAVRYYKLAADQGYPKKT